MFHQRHLGVCAWFVDLWVDLGKLPSLLLCQFYSMPLTLGILLRGKTYKNWRGCKMWPPVWSLAEMLFSTLTELKISSIMLNVTSSRIRNILNHNHHIFLYKCISGETILMVLHPNRISVRHKPKLLRGGDEQKFIKPSLKAAYYNNTFIPRSVCSYNKRSLETRNLPVPQF